MANFEKMIPFILYFEAGLKKEYLSLPHEQMFAQAKKTGFANDPDDSGGATMCGVTLGTYTMYCKKHGFPLPNTEALKNIPFNHWKAILKEMFWDRWKGDSINNQMIAVALVDWVWGSGWRGITNPQTILKVKADGVVGPVTLGAVNNYPNQRELFDRIQTARNIYHSNIAKPGTKNAKFLKGWNRRVSAITWDGFNFNV